MSTVSSSTTSTTAYKVTADTTGTLVLQTGATPTTAVTIDGSQNVGIGTTSPSSFYNSQLVLGSESASYGSLTLATTSTGTNSIYFARSNSGAGRYRGSIGYDQTSDAITFRNAGDLERARIDSSGNLLVGQTSSGLVNSNSLSIQPGGSGATIGFNHASGTSSGNSFAYFAYNAGLIGSITQNGTTGVLYNLTSDYRLKNNQEALTGAKDFIMALKPKKWQWWDGSGEGVGFVAHEFMEVAKYSGHGEKDAVETIEIKDENGNVTGTEERPVYQSIQPSSSEVMANLVAHIQNLETRLAALENK